MIADIIICAFFALVGFVAGCAFAMPFQLIKISIEPGEEDAPEEKADANPDPGTTTAPATERKPS